MCIKCFLSTELKSVLCVCCIPTLFLEHAVCFLNLGFFFKPKRPAVEDLCHSVFNFLWSPRSKVLLRKDQCQLSESNFYTLLLVCNVLTDLNNSVHSLSRLPFDFRLSTG